MFRNLRISSPFWNPWSPSVSWRGKCPSLEISLPKMSKPVEYLWSSGLNSDFILLSDRFHDPSAAEGSLELLQTEVIFVGQHEGAGKKVTFGCFRVAKVLFQVFTMSFEVFHHEVFAAELKYESQRKRKWAPSAQIWIITVPNPSREPHLKLIPKMIDSHMFLHVQVIGIVPDPGQIAPDEVPVLVPGR